MNATQPDFAPEQVTGQRLMVGFDGTRLNDQLRYYIEELKVGGIILFARNLQEPAQIRDLCAQAQEHARLCGQPPLLIAIDQEGGVVARLKPPFTQFKGNPHMRSVAEADAFAEITARELGQSGINMDMAPVLDVLPEQGPSVMEKRSFGADPWHVARMGCAVIAGLQQKGIAAVAKHFPGIGRTVLDSHQELPDLDIDPAALEEVDLLPFREAAAAGVEGMMLSHIRYTRLDAEWPASLSTVIARDLLRGRLDYGGVVMTDDLDMGAVCRHHDIETMVRRCLLADIDILLICHPSRKIPAAYDEIHRFHEQSPADGARSLRRILALKQRYAGL